MGIHTSIFRIKTIAFYEQKGYKLKLIKGDKEIKITNPVIVKEEFYFGKGVWAINEWLYRLVLKNNKEFGAENDKDLSNENIYEEPIYIEDMKKMLECIEKVLENHDLAEKIFPMPKNLELLRLRKETYDKEKKVYVTNNDDDWEKVPRKEMYDEKYFADLERAKKMLEQLITEDSEVTSDVYEIEIL